MKDFSEPPILQVLDVKKRFGKHTALHGVSFSVPRGSIYGLLGHNGAGKSTIFGTTLGQVHPSAGEVLIQGISVQQHRMKALRKVGAIFETPAFWEYLSGWENLRILARMSGVREEKPLHAAAEIVGLNPTAMKKRVGEYSHGMRQRLALAQALVPQPELLLLDEPTDGLDPVGIVETRDLMKQLNADLGITIVLSSHLLSEVEQLCRNVAILRQGRLVFEGEWKNFPGAVGSSTTAEAQLELLVEPWDRAPTFLAEHFVEILREPDAPGAPALTRLPPDLLPADLNEALLHAGFRVHILNPLRPSLEDLYRQLNQQEPAEVPAPTP